MAFRGMKLSRRAFLGGGVAALGVAAMPAFAARKVRGNDLVGDGATNNTPVLQNLLDDLSATGGGTVEIPAGVHVVDFAGDMFFNGAPQRYCIAVPSNISIVLGPGTVIKLADNADATLFMNDGISGAGNSNISISGGTLDLNRVNQMGAPYGFTGGVMFHNVDRFRTRDVQIIEVNEYAMYCLGLYNSSFENLSCDGSDGSGFHFGNDYITEGASARVSDSYFNNIVAKNIIGATPGRAFGNPFIFVGDRCYVGSVRSQYTSNGIKIQNATADCHFESLMADEVGLDGIRFQGSPGRIVKSNTVGSLHATNCRGKGVAFHRVEDIEVAQIRAYNCGVTGATPNVDIWGDVSDLQIGSVFTDTTQHDGLRMGGGNVQHINIGQVIAKASSLVSVWGHVSVAIDAAHVSIGRATTITGATAQRGAIRIYPNSRNVRIGTVDAHGDYTLGELLIESNDNIEILSLRVNGQMVA